MSQDWHEEDSLGKVYDGRLAARLWGFARPHRRWIFGSLVCMAVMSGLELVQPWLIKRTIDEHVTPGVLEGLTPIVVLFAVSLGGEMLFRFLKMYFMELAGQGLVHDLRTSVFSHLQRLPMRYFDRHPVGRIMTRVTTDVESLNDLFVTGAVGVIGDLLKLLAIVVVILWLDVRLALVTLLVVPVMAALSLSFRFRIREAYRRVRRRVARLNATLQELVSGMAVVQTLRQEDLAEEQFAEANSGHRDAELRSVIYESAFSAVVELVGSVAVASIIWFGGGQVVRDAISLGTLVAFLEYTQKFFTPIRDLSLQYTVLQSAMASSERIFALLDEPVAPGGAGAVPLAPVEGRVEFDAVHFAYRADEPVLRGLSFRAEPGEQIAVVGFTGAGKSTLAKLLLRLYEPDAGTIRLDGRDTRTIEPSALRRSVGLVLQDHLLFSGSVRYNLGLGEPDLDDARLRRAAEMVRATEFIDRLPQGLDEPVFERGNNFSVGQRQLIGLARILAFDPPVLVFDEATSSVDAQTEARIQEATRTALRGRTAIVIAHRLSTIVQADRILVLHRGRVEEQGTHSELLRLGGLYARLYQLQYSDESGTLRRAH